MDTSSPPRTRQICAKIPHDEYQQYKREARAAGIELAEYVRRRLRRKPIRSRESDD